MKNANGIAEAEKLLQGLSTSQLRAVNLNPETLSITFRFTFGPSEQDVVIDLSDTAHIAISKHLEDDEGLGVIMEARLNALSDGGTAILTELNYPLLQSAGGPVLTYPSVPLFHFHIEGDVCADVVCGRYTARKLKFNEAN